MPSFNSVARIVVALLVLGGFYLAPRFVGSAGGPVDVNPGNVRELTLGNVAGGSLTAKRTGGGQWQFAGDVGLQPDQRRINNFLLALARAKFTSTSATIGEKLGTVTLKAGLTTETLDLGSRKSPFQSELVQVDGKVYEVSEDLAAALGLWHGEGTPSTLCLADIVVFDRDKEAVVDVERWTPFADYKYVSQPAGDGYRWQLVGRKQGFPVDQEGFEHYRKRLVWLTAERPATADERQKFDYLYKLNLTTDVGTVIKLEFTGPINAAREHIGQMTAPDSAAFVVSNTTFRRMFMPTSALVGNLASVKVNEDQIRTIKGQRGNYLLEIQRAGSGWQMVQPKRSTDWVKMEGGPGMPPSDAAIEYVKAISQLFSQEIFMLDSETDARKQVYANAFRSPGARVQITLANGKTVDCVLSDAVPGVEERFLKVPGENLIVDGHMLDGLVPPLKQLLNHP